MIERHYFAGDTQLSARGRFFRYAASAAAALGLDEGLTIVVDGRKSGVLMPGDSVELDEAADRWELFPVAPGAAGEVEIGQGIVRSARTLGQVETWPADVRRAMSGRYFWNMATRTPGAGLFTVLAVVAVGRRIALRSFKVGAGATGTIQVFTADGVPDVYVQSQPCWARVLGAASSADALMVTADSTTNGSTAPAFGSTTLSGWVNFGAGRVITDMRDLVGDVPIILAPGKGFYVVTQAVATQGAAEVEVEEI